MKIIVMQWYTIEVILSGFYGFSLVSLEEIIKLRVFKGFKIDFFPLTKAIFECA